MNCTVCSLCGKPIEAYDIALNNLLIDTDHSVDICQQCIDAFTAWQGKRLSKLFPTKTMKKKYGNEQVTSR